MKTELQKTLAVIAPSISIETIWEHDPNCEREFKELQKPGNCFDGEKRGNWTPWQSEIKVTVVSGGKVLTASEYMGGTWEKKGSKPWASNPDISGYEPQMTEEALVELLKDISINEPGAHEIARQISAAVEAITAKMEAAYAAQMATA